MIELNTIHLEHFNSKNEEHILTKNELLHGKSFSKYIKQIEERLVNNKKEIFELDSAYLVYLSNQIIGYLFVSDIQKYKIYIEYSILNKHRKKGFGKLLLSEITDYILENYEVKEIALDIDVSNLPSINLAESCGYYLEDEFDKNTSMNSKEFTYINPYFKQKKK